uniref:PIH1 domain-containing protein 1 n=1 Tax=Stomoxys calcitrans TaxID=35570 RepID=A0A1I8Q4D4_STOCA
MSGSRNFLDADNSLMERNLRFIKNDFEENLSQYFSSGPVSGANDNYGNSTSSSSNSAPPREYRVVQPTPGFCIKSFKVNTNEKYFINVCQTEEIPPPEDITETELTEILNSDEPSSYRIPMSISEPRVTKDKSDNPVDAVDFAVNPKFFAKIEKSILFRDFFLVLIAEALSEKYNVQIKVDKAIILTKRKFIGTLVSHRVRNNDVKNVLSSYRNPSKDDLSKLKSLEGGQKQLVQEINANEVNALRNQSEQLKQQESVRIKQEISQASSTVPDYKLRARIKDEEVEEVQAEFFLPKCISSQEITLDIGEDRILLESMKHGYLFDKFVNYRLNQERARAIFDKTNKMLQIRIPVISA